MGNTATAATPARREPSAGADQPQCVIPNCTLDVEQWGDTCPECLRTFGAHLRPSAAPPLNHQQIVERDSYVDRALALQRQVRDGHRRDDATAPRQRLGRRA